MKVEMDRARWLAKKTARTTLAVGAWATGALRLRSAAGKPRLRVLTYHRFGNAWPLDPFAVEREVFEAHVRQVAESGLALSLQDVEEFLQGKKQVKDGSVLLTMDDGVLSVLTEAGPILKKYGVPAVAYIACDLVGTAVPELPEPFLTWEQLRELPRFGIEIGSHSCTHRSLGTLGAAEIQDEAERSRRTLEERLEVPVSSFAYPYGTPAHYSALSRSLLAQAGYRTVFTSTHGAIDAVSDPWALPRIKVEGGDPLWTFDLLRRGALDDWRFVDEALSKLQRARRAAA